MNAMAKLQPVAADPEVLRLMREVEALRLELKAMGRRLSEAQRLADHDVLTPLLNRRAFVRELQRAIALTRRHGTPACVIYVDLNEFKDVNDAYGHAAGDAVLIAVAERLLAGVREEDIVGRIGGDEFAVLLEHADVRGASARAAALASAVSGAPILSGGRKITVGLTYGVRQIGAVDSAEQALSEADAAMYLRKPGPPA
jgi:diguanylate cyclase (GGDEF)-like protein